MSNLKDTMMNKKVWAVVGVTEDEDRFGYKIWKILKENDYTAYGVSPKYDEIDGEKIYKTISDLPEKPEVIDMVVNPKIGKSILEEAADLGVKYIFFQPNTYNDELVAYADELGLETLTGDCVYKTLLIRQ